MTTRFSATQRGFTLTEMMTTVTLASVFMVVGVPGFQQIILGNQRAGITNELIAAIQLARIEAVRRGERVTLCRKKADEASCATNDTGYEQGWLVFVDTNGNASVPETDPEVIRVGSGAPRNVTLRGKTDVKDYISFMPDGLARKTDGAYQAGTLTFCHSGWQRDLAMSFAGHIRFDDKHPGESSCG